MTKLDAGAWFAIGFIAFPLFTLGFFAMLDAIEQWHARRTYYDRCPMCSTWILKKRSKG